MFWVIPWLGASVRNDIGSWHQTAVGPESVVSKVGCVKSHDPSVSLLSMVYHIGLTPSKTWNDWGPPDLFHAWKSVKTQDSRLSVWAVLTLILNIDTPNLGGIFFPTKKTQLWGLRHSRGCKHLDRNTSSSSDSRWNCSSLTRLWW